LDNLSDYLAKKHFDLNSFSEFQIIGGEFPQSIFGIA